MKGSEDAVRLENKSYLENERELKSLSVVLNTT